MGSLRYSSAKKINLTAQAHHSTLDYELQELIARFWTQEELLTNTSSKLSKEEEECERYFYLLIREMPPGGTQYAFV